MTQNLSQNFYGLTADRILDTVEPALAHERPGQRLTGQAMALNSLENRVYDLQLEDGTSVVAKFYRPLRWTADQIREEHELLYRLKASEIPVVCPLQLSSKAPPTTSLLQTQDGIYFAVFPKVKGRLVDELSESHLRTLGRYVARIHGIASTHPFRYRMKLTVEAWGRKPLHEIVESAFIDEAMANRYAEIAEAIFDRAEPALKAARYQAVHGDCHLGNTLWDGEAPFFLDFDDAMMAPRVQDIWMIIRGRDDESIRQRELLLRSYETMQEFEWEELSLIEPLRALRIVHYSAWILRRFEDPSFPKAFPLFGSPAYWRDEIEALSEILDLMHGRSRSSQEF